MKLGQRLRSLRKEKLLTLKDLSQLADLSVPYLSDMERDVVNPSVETLQKVANAFNMTVKDLFTGVEELGELPNTNYPEEFQSFLKEYGSDYKINDDWKELLLKINFRGRQPTSETEWLELYLYLKRVLSPKGKKVNNPQKYIIKLIQDTVREYSSQEDTNFKEICSGLGLEVKEAPLSLEIDGMHKGNIIFINTRIENDERRRFTLFHEITHYLVENDGDLISDLHELTYNQEGELDRQLEIYCNIGAAEFLMPREKYMRLCEEKGFNVNTIPFAASYFRCSTIAATIQLAQIAPNQCITAICEFIQDKTTPLQPQIFNQEEKSLKQKLRVTYAASSPNVKYMLAKDTVIPNDHLIHDAFGQDNPVEGESYVPFRSGKKMPCQCEALADGNRVYVLFHLSPPTSTNKMQMNLFDSS